MNGKIEALCVSRSKGERKTPVPEAVFVQDRGIEGDAHAGTGHRQVSLLLANDIEAMRRKGLPDLKPGAFAENVVVSSVALDRLGLGSLLRLGPDVVLRVTQRGKTCHAPCEIFRQTGDCIMPRVGVFAIVQSGGRGAVGDAVRLERVVPRDALQAVVLTISDRCSSGATVDTAGPAIARLLEVSAGAQVYAAEILPDERDRIAGRIRHFCGINGVDLVVAVGGTGFAPRDVTPEAVREVIEKPTPGLDEAMRATSFQKTPHAVLSRGLSGIRGRTLVVSLPGSERAAVENLSAILPALGHGIQKMRGDPADCGRPANERFHNPKP